MKWKNLKDKEKYEEKIRFNETELAYKHLQHGVAGRFVVYAILQFLGDIMVKVASLLVLYDSERSNRSVYVQLYATQISCFLDGTDVQYTERFCHKSMYSGCFQSCLGNMHVNCNRRRVLYHSHLFFKKHGTLTSEDVALPSILQCVVPLFFISLPLILLERVCFTCHGTPGHIWSISPDALNEKKEELSLHYSVWNTAI